MNRLSSRLIMAIALLSFSLTASADFITLKIPFEQKASADKKCSGKDIMSAEVMNKDGDVYQIIDYAETNSVTLNKGYYGVFIAPDKEKNSGYLRLYIKPEKTMNLARVGIRGNNPLNNVSDKELIKVKINDRYRSIPNLQLAGSSNSLEKYSYKVTPKFGPTTLICLEIEVPYVEGIDNRFQITDIYLVYDPDDIFIITEFNFPEKTEEALLGSDYKLQKINSVPETAAYFATWRSSDPDIADTDGKNVKLKKEGTVTFTAQVKEHHCFMDSEPISYTLNVKSSGESSVGSLSEANNIDWKYYDLNGNLLKEKPTAPGIYIRKSKGKSQKFLVR